MAVSSTILMIPQPHHPATTTTATTTTTTATLLPPLFHEDQRVGVHEVVEGRRDRPVQMKLHARHALQGVVVK
eukprot:scaffold126570_cov81-Phaeocystis_antarctica.AAC.3